MDIFPVSGVAWATPTAAQDMRRFSDVRVQVDGSPAGYVPYYCDVDGGTFYAGNAYDKDGNAVPSISAAGRYSLEGNCFVKLTGGTGATKISISGAA